MLLWSTAGTSSGWNDSGTTVSSRTGHTLSFRMGIFLMTATVSWALPLHGTQSRLDEGQVPGYRGTYPTIEAVGSLSPGSGGVTASTLEPI